MANTYSQINIHAIFSVKGRENLLLENFRHSLFKYISGILKNNNQFPLAVNGHLDHVHVFFELKPATSISEVIKLVKTNSSKWINKNKYLNGHFEWQLGYGAFSYSKSQRNKVINYIMNQEDHHRKSTFKEEYLKMLNDLDIKYNDNYLFDFYEDL